MSEGAGGQIRRSLAAAALGALACAGAAFLLGQGTEWDMRNYHFYNPHAFLRGRVGFDYMPALDQTLLNPIPDIPFYLLVTSSRPILVGVVLGALQGLNAGLLFFLGGYFLDEDDRRWNAALRAAFAAAGTCGVISLSEVGTTYIDAQMALPVLASLAVIVGGRAREEGQTAPLASVLWAAIIMGAGLGLKQTLVSYAVGMAPAICLMEDPWRERARKLAAWTAGVLLGACLTGGFWLLKIYREFGGAVFGFLAWINPVFMPRDWGQALFYPFYFASSKSITAMELPFRDWRLAVVYVHLVLAAAVLAVRGIRGGSSPSPRRRPFNASRFLLVFFVCSYLVWQKAFSIYRYLAPLEMLSPLAVAASLSAMAARGPVRRWAAAAATILMMAAIQPPNFGRKPWGENYFGVKIPRIECRGDCAVVMTGRRPLSYLIPFFPANWRFVLLPPDGVRRWPLESKLPEGRRAGILRQAGSLFLLSSPGDDLAAYGAVLGRYGLRIDPGGDWAVSSSFDPGLSLRRLARPGPNGGPVPGG